MKNKFITTGIIAIILLFNSTFCFATQTDGNSSDTMNLGDQITESMNKAEKSAENITNKITNNNTVNEMKNIIDNNIGGTINAMESNYNVQKTSTVGEWMQNTDMTSTTWIWIVLAMVGIVILAAVWFYAMQNSGND